jgi:uncharacterized protein HemX
MTWIKLNWRWVLACVITVFAVIASLGLYLLRKSGEAKRLRAALAISRARAKTQGLQNSLNKNKTKLDRNEEETKDLEKRLKASKEKLREKIDTYDSLDLAKEFKKRGY